MTLSENLLFGAIPSQIGQLMNLQDLRITKSGVGGLLPTELGLITDLRVLELPKNNFQGSIPTELGTLTLLGTYVRTSVVPFAFPQSFLIFKMLHLAFGPCSLSTCSPLVLPLHHHSHPCSYQERTRRTYTHRIGTFVSKIHRNIHTSHKHYCRNQLVLTLCSSSYPQGNLVNLADLRLNDNFFTGTLPTEMGTLAGLGKCHAVGSLVVVHSSRSKHALTFPFLLLRTESFTLDGNALSGSAPQEVCNLFSGNPGILDTFIVDCVNARTGLGIDCPRTTCCSFCRDTRS
jgi:hypothetical protein